MAISIKIYREKKGKNEWREREREQKNVEVA